MSLVHTVKSGECLSRIAHDYGFSDWRTLYDHPDNADFKRKRPNPNLIYPGDTIVIPAKEPKTVSIATGQNHVFKVKRSARRQLKLRLLDPDKRPLSNLPYVLVVGAERFEQSTDGDGGISHSVPIDADTGTLTIEQRIFTLQIGHLNPMDAESDEVSGVQGRLKNLRYYDGDISGTLDDHTQEAIRAFQSDHGLPVDGQPSQPTVAKLQEVYGC